MKTIGLPVWFRFRAYHGGAHLPRCSVVVLPEEAFIPRAIFVPGVCMLNRLDLLCYVSAFFPRMFL